MSAPRTTPDRLGNVIAQEGCDRCVCGCKYWENDICVDCGTEARKLTYCRHCHHLIEREPHVGWVLVETGGTYDHCPDSPKADFEDKLHAPRPKPRRS